MAGAAVLIPAVGGAPGPLVGAIPPPFVDRMLECMAYFTGVKRDITAYDVEAKRAVAAVQAAHDKATDYTAVYPPIGVLATRVVNSLALVRAEALIIANLFQVLPGLEATLTADTATVLQRDADIRTAHGNGDAPGMAAAAAAAAAITTASWTSVGIRDLLAGEAPDNAADIARGLAAVPPVVVPPYILSGGLAFTQQLLASQAAQIQADTISIASFLDLSDMMLGLANGLANVPALGAQITQADIIAGQEITRLTNLNPVIQPTITRARLEITNRKTQTDIIIPRAAGQHGGPTIGSLTAERVNVVTAQTAVAAAVAGAVVPEPVVAAAMTPAYLAITTAITAFTAIENPGPPRTTDELTLLEYLPAIKVSLTLIIKEVAKVAVDKIEEVRVQADRDMTDINREVTNIQAAQVDAVKAETDAAAVIAAINASGRTGGLAQAQHAQANAQGERAKIDAVLVADRRDQATAVPLKTQIDTVAGVSKAYIAINPAGQFDVMLNSPVDLQALIASMANPPPPIPVRIKTFLLDFMRELQTARNNLADIQRQLLAIQARTPNVVKALGFAKAAVGLVAGTAPGAPKVIPNLANDPVLEAMAGGMDMKLPQNKQVRDQLEVQLHELAAAVVNPTIAKMTALPLASLAIVSALVIYELNQIAPPPPGAPPTVTIPAADRDLLAEAVKMNDNAQATATALVPAAHLGFPGNGVAKWNDIAKVVVDTIKAKKDIVFRQAGATVKSVSIAVPKQGTHAAVSANITGPMKIPVLTGPVDKSIEPVLIQALINNRATSMRIDLEIANLMVAGFLEQHPTYLTPDEADYAIKVAMSTKEWLSYCSEMRTVGNILYERLHPEGYTARHPVTAALDRYRASTAVPPSAAPEKLAYNLHKTPLALPEKFGQVMRGVTDGSPETRSLVEAYETYQSNRTAASYDNLIGLYHRVMGYSIAA